MRDKRWLLLLVAMAAMLGLRLWHIRADFPDYHFYSQDGAKFTDEGFYTSAALNYYTLGHIYVPGGWNPGIFMPVWPLMVGLVFHFTGISVAAARSLGVVCTWISVLLVYAIGRQYRSRTFAWLTAFLVSVNALGFFYSRLAILEPALVLFLLLAIYLAGKVRPGGYALAALVGVVFVLMTLTKTTGPFVLPAVLYPMWARNRSYRSAAWKLLAVTMGVILLLLGAAKWIWFHRFQPDANIILGLNPLWQLENSPSRLARFFLRGTWIDPVLFPLALAAFVAAIAKLRFFWKDTLFVTAFLWEAGYAAFIVFHYDGPPRYFVAMIVPTVWLAGIFLEWLWHSRRPVAWAAFASVAACVLWSVAYIGVYLAHPTYTMLDASRGIRQIILTAHASHPENRELMIGRGADQFSLLSGGFPTMDSDGPMLLADKLETYRPGWFMAWNWDVPLRKATVESKKRLVARGRFEVADAHRPASVTLYQLLPKK